MRKNTGGCISSAVALLVAFLSPSSLYWSFVDVKEVTDQKRNSFNKLNSNVDDIKLRKMAAEEDDVTISIQESLAFPKIL